MNGCSIVCGSPAIPAFEYLTKDKDAMNTEA